MVDISILFKKKRIMAWSKYKDRIVDYVNKHPGCSKLDVAKLVTRHPQRDPSKQYYIVNTALRNKWIVARRAIRRSGYALYLPGYTPIRQNDKEGAR